MLKDFLVFKNGEVNKELTQQQFNTKLYKYISEQENIRKTFNEIIDSMSGKVVAIVEIEFILFHKIFKFDFSKLDIIKDFLRTEISKSKKLTIDSFYLKVE
ncbi:MAG: hypothetical protein LC122_11865 [Chitinophagales bacterium]|nr:hypothetical protein [Chitinophagales bacterium]